MMDRATAKPSDKAPLLKAARDVALMVATILTPFSAVAATVADYRRADRVRGYDNRSIGGTIFPHWLRDGHRFYFRSFGAAEAPGTVFLVDPRTRSKQKLFTVDALAKALSQASRTAIAARRLPAWRLVDERTVVARIGNDDYRCGVTPLRCVKASAVSQDIPQWASRSPDGKWDAFIYDHNVYVRPVGAPLPAGTMMKAAHGDGSGNYVLPLSDGSDEIAPFAPTGQRDGCDFPAPAGPVSYAAPTRLPPPAQSIALTSDGERLHSYGPRWKRGAEPATLDIDRYRPTPGSIYWSPDSRKLVVRREDIRGVGTYPLYSSTSDRPVDHSYLYASPADVNVPQYTLHVLDVTSRRGTPIDVPPTGLVLRPGGAQWASDSRSLAIVASNRGPSEVKLWRADAETGRARTLITERSSSFVEMGVGGSATIAAISPDTGDTIWFSERDGWAHLYRYDANGKLQNQIDSGQNAVAELVRVDYARKQLYFTAWGRAAGNPYYRHLYRVGLDGRGLTALTPEAGDHQVAMSPDGSYLLDTSQSIDRPPVTVIRALDGRVLMEVARGSDAGLRAIGWRPAETFSVKARDGVTDLWGVLHKPSNFDPAKRYPIVVNIYPGPFMGSVGYVWRFQGGDSLVWRENQGRRATHGEGMGQALAELGFIVIKLNSLGTSQRSRAMHDFFYKNVIDNGLPDQVAAVRQLAARYPWVDAGRVGIYGHSGGGFAAAAGLLTHPDFFQVGVAQAGNHDFRTYAWYWGEQYMGPLQTDADRARYARQANLTYAANLRGKLLLVHGDMDCNNPPAQTLRLADALMRAKKDFDLIMVPDAGHQMPPYIMRRSWDYFVRNLGGEQTPAEFELQEPEF